MKTVVINYSSPTGKYVSKWFTDAKRPLKPEVETCLRNLCRRHISATVKLMATGTDYQKLDAGVEQAVDGKWIWWLYSPDFN